MDGVLVVDKCKGMTSHDVVVRARRLFPHTKVGHFGTLDPLATGVLPVALGRATRLQQFYLHSKKIYQGNVRFGFSTATYDSEGSPTSQMKEISITPSELNLLQSSYVGSIEQIPPAFSAKKVKGTTAYRLARQNQQVELKPIRVVIYRLELAIVSTDEIEFKVECSSGTYVRSLAHAFGQDLGCGAHLTSLRRLASGDFTIDGSIDLAAFDSAEEKEIDWGKLESRIIPLNELVPWIPIVEIEGDELKRVRNGMEIEVDARRLELGSEAMAETAEKWIRFFDTSRELVGFGVIAKHNSTQGAVRMKPKIILFGT
jgi:tRNA pseudouridine55 synthase